MKALEEVSKKEVEWRLNRVPNNVRDNEALKWLLEHVLTVLPSAQKGWVPRPQSVRMV